MLCLNGKELARGLSPYGPHSVWHVFDLCSELLAGDNEIQLLVESLTDSANWLMVNGFAITEGDKKTTIASGKRWKMRPARAWRWSEYGVGLEYDAQSEQVDGSQPEASTWSEAVEVSTRRVPREWHPYNFALHEHFPVGLHSAGEVHANSSGDSIGTSAPFQHCKLVQRQSLLAPGGALTRIATDNDKAVFVVLDFGKPVSGYPRLRISGQVGSIVALSWSQEPTASKDWIRYRCCSGYRDWCCPRLVHLRYMILRVSDCPFTMELNGVSIMQRVGPSLPAGRFSSSQVSEEAWNAGAASLNQSRFEVYDFFTESEEPSWPSVYAYALNDFYQTGDTKTALATLEAMALPNTDDQLAWYVLVAEAYLLYSGDSDNLRTMLLEIENALWSPCAALLSTNPANLSQMKAAVLLVAASKAMANITSYAGSASAADRWSALEVELTTFFDESFWSALSAAGEDETEESANQAHWLTALTLFFDLASDDSRNKLLTLKRTPDAQRSRSMLHRFYEIGGYWNAEANQLAASGLRSWLDLQKETGSSWAEKSKNRPADCPGIEYFLGCHILGVVPLSPGYGVLSIKPDMAVMDSAAGIVNTVRGTVEVAWDRHDSHFSLDLGLEQDGKTQVHLPRGDLRFPRILLNGETVWQNEKVRPNADVRELMSDERGITLVLERSGSFKFEIE